MTTTKEAMEALRKVANETVLEMKRVGPDRPIAFGRVDELVRACGRALASYGLEESPHAEGAPVPGRIPCPECGELHVDEGEYATKPHHTHACQRCGTVWRPFVVATVGVRFLPGFKDEERSVEDRVSELLAGTGRVCVPRHWLKPEHLR